MTDDLLRHIQRVKDARHALTAAKHAYLIAFEAWQAEHEPLIDALSDAQRALETAETDLRAATVAVFEATGDKKPAPGVGIRVMQKLDYDQRLAFSWALDHRIALQLNRREFESIAKIRNLDFVTLVEVPTATIAANLDDEEAE